MNVRNPTAGELIPSNVRNPTAGELIPSNVRNPTAGELIPSTRLDAVAQPMGDGMPMSISARHDALNIGVAYGRTFAVALRNLADVLEGGSGTGDRGYHPVRAALHQELDNWLDYELGVSDGHVLDKFREAMSR